MYYFNIKKAAKTAITFIALSSIVFFSQCKKKQLAPAAEEPQPLLTEGTNYYYQYNLKILPNIKP